MKYTFLTLFTLAISIGSGYTQVSIQTRSLFPEGYTAIIASEMNPNISAPDSGANRVWDLQNLPFTSLDTIGYVRPSASPRPNLIPGQRAKLYNGGRLSMEYMRFSGDSIIFTGYSGISSRNNLVVFPYSPEWIFASQNLTVNAPEERDLYAYRVKFELGMPLNTPFVVDSIDRRRTTHMRRKVIGWGTATTPLGTYQALLQRVDELSEDTADFKNRSNGQWLRNFEVTNTRLTRYYFWTPQHPYPLAVLTSTLDPGFIDQSEYLHTPGTTTAIPSQALHHPMHVFPIPATDHIQILWRGADVESFRLLGIHGQICTKGNFTRGLNTISTRDLPPGMYELKAGGYIQKIVVE